MQAKNTRRLTFSVVTSIEDTSFYSSDHDERRDQWAFRRVIFYALPLQSHEQLNKWIMIIVQGNVTSDQSRYLWLDPVVDSDGRITGVRVESTCADPPPDAVAQFKMEEKVFETQDEGEATPHRVYYFHYELMAHLRDGFTQAVLLPHTTGNSFQFYLNYMYFLVRAGIVKEAAKLGYMTFSGLDGRITMSLLPRLLT
ncbi:hypothetical protein RSOL_419900, partial [Rhizoctonia solani AG-3 Rhs1AP]